MEHKGLAIKVAAGLLAACLVFFCVPFNTVKGAPGTYKIAVLSDSLLNGQTDQAPCDIQNIQALYAGAGHTVTLLSISQLAAAGTFNRSGFDILILPYGPKFPQTAVSNVKTFFAAGGRIITLGGYAFRDIVDASGNLLTDTGIKAQKMGSNAPDSAADRAFFDSSAIPVFDLDHQIEGGAYLQPSDEQAVFSGELTVPGSISGWSSVCVLGNNRGRLQPLIDVCGSDGQLKGTAGAIMHLLPNPYEYASDVTEWKNYKGTAIAFFGITSHDLLAAENNAIREGFLKLPDLMMNDTYISRIDNKFDNYRDGESPEFTAVLENSNNTLLSGRVKFTLSYASGQCVYVTEKAFTTRRNDSVSVTGVWEKPMFYEDFYQIKAEVFDSGGHLIDVCFSGFSVWFDKVVKNGVDYTYQDNYITFTDREGNRHSTIVSGADDSGNIFGMFDATPLAWKKAYTERKDMGMHLYENLMVFDLNVINNEQFMRKIDNAVYLAQKYDQIYMMGVLIGKNVAMNQSELDDAREICRRLAERYKGVKGLIYYLNGDLRVQMSGGVSAELNQFLSDKYGTNAAFRTAWGNSYTLGSVTAEEYSQNGTGWTDIKASDYNAFRTYIIKRWTSALIESIRTEDSSGKAILCEFYHYPYEAVDIPTAIGDLTYSNIGFFETYREFPQNLAYSDQRNLGKSMGVGEFGKRTHPLFTNAASETHRSASKTEAMNHLFNIYNATYTMGGNHIQAWSWEDESKYLFPWGLKQLGDRVSKDSFYYFRNMNLYTKMSTPVYKTPEVAFLTADNTRLAGAKSWARGHYSVVSGLTILQSTNVDGFITLNDSNLVIPEGIKVIFYPLSYNPSDEVYTKLKQFVNNGGVLYLSGDISYDENKQRTKTARLSELCGITTSGSVLFNGTDSTSSNTTYSNGTYSNTGKQNFRINAGSTTVLYRDNYVLGNRPVIVQNTYGKGKVVFSAIALELIETSSSNPGAADVAIYRHVLNLAGISVSDVGDPLVKILKTDLHDGGKTVGIFNANTGSKSVSFESGGRQLGVSLQGGQTVNITQAQNGDVISAFQEGTLLVNNQTVLQNSAYAMVMSRDEKDLQQSKSLLILPQKTGWVSISSQLDFENPLMVSGIMENGVFRKTNEQALMVQGTIEINVSEQMKNKIILIAEAAQMQRLIDNTAYNLSNPVTLPLGSEIPVPKDFMRPKKIISRRDMLEDFESYSDTASMEAAFGRKSGGAYLGGYEIVLSSGKGANGSKALEIKGDGVSYGYGYLIVGRKGSAALTVPTVTGGSGAMSDDPHGISFWVDNQGALANIDIQMYPEYGMANAGSCAGTAVGVYRKTVTVEQGFKGYIYIAFEEMETSGGARAGDDDLIKISYIDFAFGDIGGIPWSPVGNILIDELGFYCDDMEDTSGASVSAEYITLQNFNSFTSTAQMQAEFGKTPDSGSAAFGLSPVLLDSSNGYNGSPAMKIAGNGSTWGWLTVGKTAGNPSIVIPEVPNGGGVFGNDPLGISVWVNNAGPGTYMQIQAYPKYGMASAGPYGGTAVGSYNSDIWIEDNFKGFINIPFSDLVSPNGARASQDDLWELGYLNFLFGAVKSAFTGVDTFYLDEISFYYEETSAVIDALELAQSSSLAMNSTYVYQINPATGISAFIQQFNHTGYVHADSEDIIKTGTVVLLVIDGLVMDSRQALIYGDVNGDGYINGGDIVSVKKHLLGIEELSGPYRKAACLDKNIYGRISVCDMVLIKRHIVNISPIIQA